MELEAEVPFTALVTAPISRSCCDYLIRIYALHCPVNSTGAEGHVGFCSLVSVPSTVICK